MFSLFDDVSCRRPMGRRDFLRVGGMGLGALGLGGLATPGVSPASAGSALASSVTTGKSVVFLFMQGGPPQHETFDPKTDVPSEIASIGGAIPTSVPGLAFGESLPRLAQLAHRLAVVHCFETGTQHGGLLPIVSKLTHDASIGAVYSRVAGTNHPATGLPNAMALWPKSVVPDQPGPRDQWGRFHATGALGAAYAPFIPGAEGPLQDAMTMKLPRQRLEDRRHLLAELDRFLRQMDDGGPLAGLDGLRKQSFEIILKGVADAFDLSREDPRTIERYDTSHFYNPALWTDSKGKEKTNKTWYTAHTKTLGKLLLLARRLCEAGCGFVTINTEFVWDFHQDGNNVGVVEGKRLVIEPFDHAVSAFIEDCEARGLSDQILLVCCGEMGRTPKVNKGGGRDHWPKLAPLMLYGGGRTSGQVVGRSTRDGGSADGPSLKPDDLAATIFHALFDYGQVRLIADLPSQLKQTFAQVEDMPGVL
jgi:hypothetical protein